MDVKEANVEFSLAECIKELGEVSGEGKVFLKKLQDEFEEFEDDLLDLEEEASNHQGTELCTVSIEDLKDILNDEVVDREGLISAVKAGLSCIDVRKEWIKSYCARNEVKLLHLFLEMEHSIKDGCSYVVTSDDHFLGKGEKKYNNAVKEYAYFPGCSKESVWFEPDGEFLVLFDTTVFGSASEGIFITDQSICLKKGSKKRKRIELSPDLNLSVRRGVFRGEGFRYEFGHPEIGEALEKVVDVVANYFDQPALKVVDAINEC